MTALARKEVARVAMIMPVFNEERFLRETLASVSAQTYPHGSLRLICVDNRSSDQSASIIEEWATTSGIPVNMLSSAERSIPKSLNVAIAHVRDDEIVIRLDSHTRYGADYVDSIVRAFARHPYEVGCVGGALVPEAGSSFSARLVATLYNNPMGLGGAPFRHAKRERMVRDVYLGAWRQGILQRVGGFAEGWEANEDSELAARVCEAGFGIVWLPLESEYMIKRGPAGTVVQWWRYGYWRAQTLARHPAEIGKRHIVAPLATLLALLSLCSAGSRRALLVAYVVYAWLIFAKRARSTPVPVAIVSCLLFPVCQVAWTVGLLRGLLTIAGRRARPRGGVGRGRLLGGGKA